MALISNGIFGCKHPEAETYLIPDGFKGTINIIFNQSKGNLPRYENGRRIYEIPANGILLTQFKDEYGIVDHKYFYVARNGNRIPLKIFKYEYNKDGTIKWLITNRHEVGIFFDGTTGTYGNRDAKYQEFRVADYFGLDSIESPNNFMKRVGKALEIDFRPDTLNSRELDTIEKHLDKKNH